MPFVAVQPFDPIHLAMVGQSDSARNFTCEGITDPCDANIICLNSRCVDASTLHWELTRSDRRNPQGEALNSNPRRMFD